MQLGVSSVYHMRDVSKNHHQELWTRAMEAKFEDKGSPWTREDFEEILAGYEVFPSLFPQLGTHPITISFSTNPAAKHPPSLRRQSPTSPPPSSPQNS